LTEPGARAEVTVAVITSPPALSIAAACGPDRILRPVQARDLVRLEQDPLAGWHKRQVPWGAGAFDRPGCRNIRSTREGRRLRWFNSSFTRCYKSRRISVVALGLRAFQLVSRNRQPFFRE